MGVPAANDTRRRIPIAGAWLDALPAGTVLPALLIGAGLVVRVAPVLLASFPLNDGGLFAQMIGELRSAGFELPARSGYNGLDIPYAYPPLAIYVAALLTSLTPLTELDVLHLLPAAVNLATIPVAYLVLRQLVAVRRALLATGIFAVLPRSYTWLIAGGGLTRSFGFLFALIAVYAALRALRGDRRMVWLGGLSLGAAALSHPEAPLFAIVSVGLLGVLRAPDRRRALFDALGAGVIAAAVVMPWVVVVVSGHGIDPFLAAAGASEPISTGILVLRSLRWDGVTVPILSAVAGFGFFVCAMNRLWLPPLWFAAIVLVDPRAGLTFGSLPLAMATVIGFEDLWRWVTRLRSRLTWAPASLVRVAVGMAAVLAFVPALTAGADSSTPLRALSDPELAAMEWARANTPPDSEFLVVAGVPWQIDAVGEWFPVIAGRRSVATVQGTEWLGPGRFVTQREAHENLMNCSVTSDLPCVRMWIDDQGPVDYVILLDSRLASAYGYACCVAKAGDLLAGLTNAEVFRAPGVAVYRLD